jgi:hypothetical protein
MIYLPAFPMSFHDLTPFYHHLSSFTGEQTWQWNIPPFTDDLSIKASIFLLDSPA